MRRIKLTVEYDGTSFHGFQTQKNELPTVQDAIEKAILKITGKQVNLQVAGRTDAGVHATGQVCHFDIDANNKLIDFKDGINRFTPFSLSIIKAEEVTENFQARFDCFARNYEYLIFNRRTPSPFYLGKATHIIGELNVENMQKASKYFIGEHDFSAFRSPECSAKSPIKTMYKFDVERTKEHNDLIKFTIRGSAFLHNMVRIMTGTLVMVGKGKLQPSDVEKILQSKNRKLCPLTLPPEGLYFTGAEYPEYEVKEATY